MQSDHWPERMKIDMNRKYASKDLKYFIYKLFECSPFACFKTRV